MTTWLCPKCGKTVEQPVTVTAVAHRCPRARRFDFTWMKKERRDA